MIVLHETQVLPYLSHHGILGMKWGIRRFQNADGSLTSLGRKRYVGTNSRIERKDLRWVHKNEQKLKRKALKKSKKELRTYEKELSRYLSPYLKNGELSKKYAILYNQRMADLMNTKLRDVKAPSGRVVRFIAKRGEIGVYTALADPNYDLSTVRKGVYDSGRVAYKKEQLQKVNYISHHGIKGQRWGVINGPPYPLDSSTHRKVAAGEKQFNVNAHADQYIKQFRDKEISGVDLVTLAHIAYLSANAAIVAAVFLKNESDYKSDIKQHMETPKTNLQKQIKGPHTQDDDQAAINPDYADRLDFSARVNCAMCSAAYELRRRGYDVVARKTEKGRKPKDVARWFNINEKDIPKFRSRDAFIKALQNEPNGSRGLTFTAIEPSGSHHCMIWENANGAIRIRDAQCNAKYSSIERSTISRYSDIPYRYIRTDNAPINWDAIHDAVKERR